MAVDAHGPGDLGRAPPTTLSACPLPICGARGPVNMVFQMPGLGWAVAVRGTSLYRGTERNNFLLGRDPRFRCARMFQMCSGHQGPRPALLRAPPGRSGWKISARGIRRGREELTAGKPVFSVQAVQRLVSAAVSGNLNDGVCLGKQCLGRGSVGLVSVWMGLCGVHIHVQVDHELRNGVMLADASGRGWGPSRVGLAWSAWRRCEEEQ